MQGVKITKLPSQANPTDTFFARVREDRQKGLRPAGQVYPPPTKEENAAPVPHDIPAGYS